MVGALRKTAKELTGREPSVSDAERWGELAELLSTELKLAAARTTVSNVPAFLTEHLRRRLWKTDKNPSKGQQTPGTAAPANVNECPDCRGTGLFYPEGFEKGVARCRHEKLSNHA